MKEDRTMTVKQYRKAVQIARKYGRASLDNGCILHYYGPHGWAIHEANGQTVDTASNPSAFEYLFD
jgi:hypothetical protein